MGSAAAWALARRGRDVTLLEQFGPGHRIGASHGATRNLSLAYSEPDFQEAVLRSPLERFNPMTVTDPAELRRTLAHIRQTGVAVARGQITMPDMVVAVPVLDPAGDVTAALSVVVKTEGARPRELAAVLKQASRAITRALSPRR